MSTLPNVVVAVGRCSKSKKGFGIRFEEVSPGKWCATWAFAINENIAKREGYSDAQQISGSFEFAEEYPGCPHCGLKAFVQCSCDKISCWDGETMRYTCAYCKRSGKIAGTIADLNAGGDR